MDNDITFFTIPRDSFGGFYGVAMNNAIESWKLLDPCPEIILLGDSPDIRDAAKRFDCSYRKVRHDKRWGIPLVGNAMHRAEKYAKGKTLCFANTDMIFIQDIYDAILNVSKKFPRFLIIGKKRNIEISDRIDFADDWQARLLAQPFWLGGDLGNDYWIYSPKNLYKNVPDFLISRRVAHCWLVWDVLRRQIPVVNATEAIAAFHQDPPERKFGKVRIKEGPDFQYNFKLVGKENVKIYNRAARISKMKWILTRDGEVRKRKQR